MISAGTEEYLFTIGIVLSFLGTLLFAFLSRRDISESFSSLRLRKWHWILAVLIVVLFVCVELYFVQPTQQLFFDDAIYQSMAVDLLRTGQAWMCDYGTPGVCYIGEIFHEPIGTSFNLAMGFALLGVNRNAAYATEMALSTLGVIFAFLTSLLLFRNVKAALFSELLLALSPILLVYAMPTTSDVPTLTYSLIALFALLIFIRKKNVWTFATFAFALSLLSYMKVNDFLFFIAAAVMFIALDESGIGHSVRRNAKRIGENLFNTKLLLILLAFVLVVTPSLLFAYSQYLSGDFGYQGSPVQNSCSTQPQSMTAAGNFNLANFEYNICANVYFWFNQYGSQYIMQPVFFTALAIFGAMIMLFEDRRLLLALGIWFLAFFLLYTAFYAGAVTYGVDWRFMLSLIAPACMFGGYGCAALSNLGSSLLKRLRLGNKIFEAVVPAIILLLVLYSIYMQIPQLSVSPSQIMQAGDARFYENFVYNESHLIPQDCAVFTYDPTLFIINNKTALQMSYIYNTQEYQNVSSKYACLIVDYGYWCYTPDNLCTALSSSFKLKTIANATYQPMGKTFSLYLIENKSI